MSFNYFLTKIGKQGQPLKYENVLDQENKQILKNGNISSKNTSGHMILSSHTKYLSLIRSSYTSCGGKYKKHI